MINLEDIKKYINLLLDKEMTWDNYFMINALVTSLRSKDPNTKVGAVLVKNHIQIGAGYNGFPRTEGNNDKKFPWDREDPHNNKYMYVIHAEMNAILNSRVDPSGSTLYVTASPCNNCMKHLAQAGIKRIVYLLDYDKDDDSYKAAVKIAKECNIKLEQMMPTINKETYNYPEFCINIKKYLNENNIVYKIENCLLIIGTITFDLTVMFEFYIFTPGFNTMDAVYKYIDSFLKDRRIKTMKKTVEEFVDELIDYIYKMYNYTAGVIGGKSKGYIRVSDDHISLDYKRNEFSIPIAYERYRHNIEACGDGLIADIGDDMVFYMEELSAEDEEDDL